MEEVPAWWKSEQLASSAAAVRIVAHNRMSDRGEMYPDLMRASREEMCSQEIRGIEARKPREIRPRRPSSTDDCHPLSVSRIAGDRPLDG
jgi:hypothetical protein